MDKNDLTPNREQNRREHRSILYRKQRRYDSQESTPDYTKYILSSLGNNRVGQMLEGGFVQTKLDLNTPGDSYEEEADQVAEKVVNNAAASVVQPKKSSTETKGEAGSSIPETTASEIKEQKGKGSAMSRPLREYFEPRMGVDLGDVRIHTGSKANRLAGTINARAFTHGNDIFFRDGEYRPGTEAGKKLIAHELVHTMQQGESVKRKVAGSQSDSTSKSTSQAHHRIGYNEGDLYTKDDWDYGYIAPNLTSKQELLLAPWRDRDSKTLLFEMYLALIAGGGSEGAAAFAHFGTQSRDMRKVGQKLTQDAREGDSFIKLLQLTKDEINRQLREQLAADPQATPDITKVFFTPPCISFKFWDDSLALKTVIGGTQRAKINLLDFKYKDDSKLYGAKLEFKFYDVFGVGANDIYLFPGLIPFWILQHERGYPPHVQLLELEETIFGTLD